MDWKEFRRGFFDFRIWLITFSILFGIGIGYWVAPKTSNTADCNYVLTEFGMIEFKVNDRFVEAVIKCTDDTLHVILMSCDDIN